MSTIPAPLPKPGRACVSGVTDCGFAQHQVFECAKCSNEVCWCQGGNDADKPHLNEWCADCAAKDLHAKKDET